MIPLPKKRTAAPRNFIRETTVLLDIYDNLRCFCTAHSAKAWATSWINKSYIRAMRSKGFVILSFHPNPP